MKRGHRWAGSDHGSCGSGFGRRLLSVESPAPRVCLSGSCKVAGQAGATSGTEDKKGFTTDRAPSLRSG